MLNYRIKGVSRGSAGSLIAAHRSVNYFCYAPGIIEAFTVGGGGGLLFAIQWPRGRAARGTSKSSGVISAITGPRGCYNTHDKCARLAASAPDN